MDKQWIKNNVLKFRYVLILAVILLCVLVGTNIYATERRTVRVAFFPMEGYHHINEDGSYGGMDVEYLNAICRYVTWDIEYVVCDSWGDALAKLENKEVDLVGSAQYSEARAEDYDFADLPSGYTFGMIATNPGSEVAYEDFTMMRLQIAPFMLKVLFAASVASLMPMPQRV
jgi:ABC-type amino acid transport substrate-binding protein